jgi:hypothetical protein
LIRQKIWMNKVQFLRYNLHWLKTNCKIQVQVDFSCNKTPGSHTKLRINIVRIKPSHTPYQLTSLHQKESWSTDAGADGFRENRNAYDSYM